MYEDDLSRPLDPQLGQNRRLSPLTYASVVILTGSLAVVQFYFLPRNLGAAEFGLAVLGLSITQAALQFSDLGLINASLRSDVSVVLRSELRKNAVSLSKIICVALALASCAAGLSGSSFGYISATGFASCLFLISGRACASASVQKSDERAATWHNIAWQNAAKIGSVAGSFSGMAIVSMLGAVLTSAMLGKAHLPRRIRFSFLLAHRRLWLPGLAVSASAFLMSWVDTYTLSIVAGVTAAGDYQAIVRPLTGISYLYLPIIALIQAAFNAKARRRVKLFMFASLLLGSTGSACVALFLVALGRKIWPLFAFDPPTVIAAATAAAAMCAATVFGGQLVLLGYHTIAAVNTSLGAALLALVSIVTVPEMGGFGAGFASALAWTFVLIAHAAVLTKKRRTKRGA